MDIRIEILGRKRMSKSIRDFERSLEDATAPMTASLMFMRNRIIKETSEGRDLDGKAFAKYSDSYKEWLARKGLLSGKKWLFLSGLMMKGMKKTVSRNSAELGYRSWGPAALRANVHQYGAKGGGAMRQALSPVIGRKKGAIPARPWFGWRRGDKQHVVGQIFWPWIVRMAKRSGLTITGSL